LEKLVELLLGKGDLLLLLEEGGRGVTKGALEWEEADHQLEVVIHLLLVENHHPIQVLLVTWISQLTTVLLKV
jgi:hypothetical protein